MPAHKKILKQQSKQLDRGDQDQHSKFALFITATQTQTLRNTEVVKLKVRDTKTASNEE